MAVIALASSKGGCGKSTTTIVLAGSFAEQGYTVRIIDADPAQRIVRWAEAGLTGPNITVSGADARTVVQAIRDAEAEAEIVLIDVEGSMNMVVPLAIGQSNFVIIPAQPSAADVEEALATVQVVNDTPTKTGRTVPYGLLWTRVPTQIPSREFVALADQVRLAEVPVIGSIPERTIYKSLISYSTTLDQLPRSAAGGIDKARAEGATLAEAVSASIISAQEAA